MTQLKIIQGNSYKVGIDEVVSLKVIMKALMQPVANHLKDSIYWADEIELIESEYKFRDGFSPYASNCGGIEICEIVPKCEESEFSYVSFGEHDDDCSSMKEDSDGFCSCGEDEGHLDAKVRIWFKFEGINDQGEMEFYLVLSGGNDDAPYFREKHSKAYFEASFTAKTLKQLATKGKKEIAKLLKFMT